MLKNFYLQLKGFLDSIKNSLGNAVVITVLAILVYLFLNNFLFGYLLLNKARVDETNKKYDSAITLYKINNIYYGVNRYSKTNKEIFFEIPYNIANCYLEKGEKEKAFKTLLNAQAIIQQTYGFFSWEYATFIREYLIDFYFKTENYSLASREFENLMLIYKKIGYNPNEMADMMQLCAKIYANQGKEDTAIDLNKRAYETIIIQNEGIDYKVLATIVNNIGEYEILHQQPDNAIKIYKETIQKLKKAGKEQNELTAQMLISLGNVYKEISVKDAIKSYEEAIPLVKSLPSTTDTKQNLITYLKALQELYTSNHQYKKADETGIEITKAKRFSFLF